MVKDHTSGGKMVKDHTSGGKMVERSYQWWKDGGKIIPVVERW